MADPERNPERGSDRALLCMIIGIGLMALAYFLGFGSLFVALATGGDPTVLVGSFGAQLAAVLAFVSGIILAGIGGVWVVVRVIADSRGEAARDRYSKDVER